MIFYFFNPIRFGDVTGVFSNLSLNEPAGCARRFYKNWHNSKQKAFTKYQKKWSEESKEGTPMNAEAGFVGRKLGRLHLKNMCWRNSLFLLGIKNWNLFERKLPSFVCTVLIWFFWVYHLNRLVTVFPSVLRQGRTSQEVLPGDSCYLSHAGGAFCSNLHRWSPKHSENDDVWIVDVYGYDVSRTFIGNLWKAKGNYMKIPAATVQHKECEWFHVSHGQNKRRPI